MEWNTEQSLQNEPRNGTDARGCVHIPIGDFVEMTTLKAIHAAGGHDNIARVLDVFEDSTFYFFVLELVSVVVWGPSSLFGFSLRVSVAAPS